MRSKLILLCIPLLLLFSSLSFAAQLYVTTSATPGGTITPLKGRNAVATNGSLSVTFTANDGYYLAELRVNKVVQTITSRKTMTWQFSNVTTNQTIAAKFLKDPFITVTKPPGGTVTPSGKVFVPYSTSRTFTYAPQTGYHLESVTADRNNVGTPEDYTFNYVKTNHTLKVKFAINTYSVTTNAGDGGSIAPAGFPAVKHGQKKVFTVKPASGMRIATLSVNGTPVEGLPPSGPYKLSLTITDNTVIAATFIEFVASGTQRLKGNYLIVSDENAFFKQAGNNPVGEPIAGDRITASFNGNGICKIGITGSSYNKTSDQTGNESVNVEANSGPSSCTYAVNDADGTFILTMPTPEGTETVTGWVSTDGNVIITGGFEQRIGTGSNEYSASTVTGVRSGSGISKATAAGTYHLVSRDTTLWKQQGIKTHVSDNYFGDRVAVTFNAAGGCTINRNSMDFNKQTDNVGNEFVNVSPESLTISSCTYTVAGNGALTMKITDNEGLVDTVKGWFSADGNAIAMGGAEQRTDTDGTGTVRTGYTANHTFGVRDGSGMGVASVNGLYKLIGSDFTFKKSLENGQTRVKKLLSGNKVDATFDGAGGCTISFTNEGYSANSGDNTVQVETDSGTITVCSYSVGSDGGFTLNLNGGGGDETITGRVSADGSTLLIGGPEQKTDDINDDLYEVSLMVGTKVKMP